MNRIRRRLTYANVMSTVAVFLLVAGGSAVAASKITGAQIANNAITTLKVKNGSLLKADFKAGQILAGPAGPPGANGLNGTARAYGFVDNSSGTAVMSKAIGGVAVRRSGNGVFCITAPGIDPNATPIAVTSSAKSSGLAIIFVGSGGAISQQCTGTEFQVVTLSVANLNVGLNTASFEFVIP